MFATTQIARLYSSGCEEQRPALRSTHGNVLRPARAPLARNAAPMHSSARMPPKPTVLLGKTPLTIEDVCAVAEGHRTIAIDRDPELRKRSAQSQGANLLHTASMTSALAVYVLFNGEVPPFGPAQNWVEFGGCCVGGRIRSALAHPRRTSGLGATAALASDVVLKAIGSPAKRQRASNVNSFAFPWEMPSLSELDASRRRWGPVPAR